jgi:hypothetical protein
MIMLVQIVSGSLREGQRIIAYASSREFADEFSKDVSVQEIGLLTPTSLRTRSLSVSPSLLPSLSHSHTHSLSLLPSLIVSIECFELVRWDMS